MVKASSNKCRAARQHTEEPRVSYSEKIASQLVRHNGTSEFPKLTTHMWAEVERIAHGFASHENEWGLEFYSGLCAHKLDARSAA